MQSNLLIAMIHFKVNNAGISGLGTIENTSLDLFDQIMRINVRYELEEKSLVNCLIIEDRLFSSIIGLLNFCYFDYISQVSVLFNFSSSSISNTNTRLVVSCFGLFFFLNNINREVQAKPIFHISLQSSCFICHILNTSLITGCIVNVSSVNGLRSVSCPSVLTL